MKLDIDFVRQQFPAFSEEGTRDWIFFENAGGSYVPRQVTDCFQQFLLRNKVQPYGSFALSERAGDQMDRGYQAMAALINADPDEITIGPSTTLNLYVLAQGLRHLLRPGDEIIVTNQDHEANIGCWRRLAEHGVRIREWQIGKADGELDLSDLEALINEKTKVVCCTLSSNLVGTYNDMVTIAGYAHAVGALVVADGVSYAPHVIANAPALGVDFYVYSTYKTFGPHQSILWGAPNALEQVEAQGHFFNENEPRYRLNPTGPQHAEIAAMAGITDYFDALYEHHFTESVDDQHTRAIRVFELVAEHEAELANVLLSYLGDKPDIRLLGQDQAKPGGRTSTISFHARAMPSAHIAQRLAEYGIGVGAGDFYAARCVEALGMDPNDGVVRVSMVHYNTRAEVERLVESLDHILSGS